MIIVLGAVIARLETLDELHRISVEHVQRSRQEPGCHWHEVTSSLEDPLRLVFLERWEDMDTLNAHFARPESMEFVARVGELSAERPELIMHKIA